MYVLLFRDSGMIVSDNGAVELCLLKILYLEAMYEVKYGLEPMYIVKGLCF